MSNIPTSFDAFTECTDVDALFQIDLLTANPTDETLINNGTYSLPSDGAYEAQQVAGTVFNNDGNYAEVQLDPALFDPQNFTTTQNITAYLVSLVYDNGNVPIGTFDFAQAVAFGAASDSMTIAPRVEVFGFGSNIPFNY